MKSDQYEHNAPVILFPGQGSQYVGMGKDLYQEYPFAREKFKEADDILNVSLTTICFEGPDEELKKTINTQPAIFLVSTIIADILKSYGLKYSLAAGHSLGEYSAHYFCDTLSFKNALETVRLRGTWMYEAGLIRKGSMLALSGLAYKEILKLCEQTEKDQILQIANINSPGQIVLSGDYEAVFNIMEKAKKAGATAIIPLAVSGAFHSKLMKPASEKLNNLLDSLNICRAKHPVISNYSAKPVQEIEEIRNSLKMQLESPVKWQASIENIISNGFNHFLELGPGKVLTGLLRRINKEAKCFSIGDVRGIEKLINTMLKK